MNTEGTDDGMTTTEPTPQPKRNNWMLASLGLGIVAAVLVLVVVALIVVGPLGSSTTPSGSPLSRACLNFEDLDVGTKMGSDDRDQPGDVVITTDEGIVVRVQPFLYSDPAEGGTFRDAEIKDDPNYGFKTGKYVWFNNVTLDFDFDALPFDVAAVEFQYRAFGGNENLGVNGSDLHRSQLADAPASFGAVSWSIKGQGGQEITTGTLKGHVEGLRVGGQELSIDNVCATA